MRSLCLAAVFAATSVLAAPGNLIPYQGRVERNGQPINGNMDLKFELFTAPTGGSAIWTDSFAQVPVASGTFSVVLGSGVALPTTVWTSSAVYVQVSVKMSADSDFVKLNNRQRVLAVPYASAAAASTFQAIDQIEALGAISGASLSTTGNATIGGTLSSTGNISTSGNITAASGIVTAAAYRARVIRVVPTTNYTFSSANTWADSDLTATFSLAQSATVLMDYRITGSGGDSHIVLRLVIDGIEDPASRTITGNTSFWNADGNSARELSAGQHTVKLQYRTPSGQTNQPTATDFHSRSLQIVIFGQ